MNQFTSQFIIDFQMKKKTTTTTAPIHLFDLKVPFFSKTHQCLLWADFEKKISTNLMFIEMFRWILHQSWIVNAFPSFWLNKVNQIQKRLYDLVYVMIRKMLLYLRLQPHYFKTLP